MAAILHLSSAPARCCEITRLGYQRSITVRGAARTENANPHEVTLAISTLLQMVVPDAPQNLIGDNAYDSDHLDAELRLYGIKVIAPHRRTRTNSTQDGRRPKRYRRRWKIERLFAWCRTSGVWSLDMNVTRRTFLVCFNSPRL